MSEIAEGSNCFVASLAAPIATGWSDLRRAGAAPAQKRHLVMAHWPSKPLA
jgi:hypothetical protein